MKAGLLRYDAVSYDRFLPPFPRIMRPSVWGWMETAGFSETFATVWHTARLRIQEDSNFQYGVVVSYSCLSVSNSLLSTRGGCIKWQLKYRAHLLGYMVSQPTFRRNIKPSSLAACYLLHTGFLLGLLSDPEGRCDRFIRNVGCLSTGCILFITTTVENVRS
jgi:hypothetical protein